MSVKMERRHANRNYVFTPTNVSTKARRNTLNTAYTFKNDLRSQPCMWSLTRRHELIQINDTKMVSASTIARTEVRNCRIRRYPAIPCITPGSGFLPSEWADTASPCQHCHIKSVHTYCPRLVEKLEAHSRAHAHSALY